VLHFISGLPRSGSTLLAAILNQNPAAQAGIESPMGPIVNHLLTAMGPDVETHWFLNEAQRRTIIRNAFVGYHGPQPHARTFFQFDTNRMWAAKLPLLNHLFPEARFIIMLRPYDQIIDSFERVFREHSTYVSKIFGAAEGAETTVYGRVGWMISAQGVLGYAVNAAHEAWSGPLREKCLFVEYDSLVNDPAYTMKRITEHCGMSQYDYDFDNLEQILGVEQFDQSIGTPGLHTVGKKVAPKPYVRHLPENVYQMLIKPFWFKEDETTSE
jgi:sulfotransferase